MITYETRRKAYGEVLKSLGTRQAQVFTELLCFSEGLTASELAVHMHSVGFFRSPERNNTHPRLNELEDMSLVEVVGKRQCRVTNKTVAVYKVDENVIAMIMEELS